MKSIFGFTDYRKYLQDFYLLKKSANPIFSYQYIAKKAGFKSKSFFPHVVEGKKNLSEKSIFKLGKLLDLDGKSFSYFKDLVAFNQATEPDTRNYHFSRLSQYNRRNQQKIILKNQYKLYSELYHNTIRELVTIADFKEDFKLLAEQVNPKITARQARMSVRLLLNLGLIEKTLIGYRQTQSHISTGDEIKSLAVHQFHIQNLELAKKKLENCPSNERDISAMVLGFSPKGFEKAKMEVQAFRKRISVIAEEDEPAHNVYHLNIQLFPTTNSCKKGDLHENK